MSYQQQLNAWFAKFENRMEVELPKKVAETAVEFFNESFKTQSWDGKPWPNLKPKYAAKKRRGRGRILTASGALARSIRPTVVNSQRVVITAGRTTLPYAKIHNTGGTVNSTYRVRSFTNKNFMGKRKAVKISSHERTVNYTMPKRQFMGHGRLLNQRIRTRLIEAFNK